MQRNPALEKLSPIHALALRLDALGADRELIASCLRVAPETVGPLLEVAAAKLARAERDLASAQDAEASPRVGDGADHPPTGSDDDRGGAPVSRQRRKGGSTAENVP